MTTCRMLLSKFSVVCKMPRGGTLLNSKCPAPGTNLASNARGLRGAGGRSVRCSRLELTRTLYPWRRRLFEGSVYCYFFLSNAAFNRINTVKDVLRSISLCVCVCVCVCVCACVSLPYNNVLLLKVHQHGSQDVT